MTQTNRSTSSASATKRFFLRLSAVAALAALPLAVACSAGDDATPAPSPDQEIITGQKETARPGVVMIQISKNGSSALCTATMIATNPATKIGYVLTAAHCVRDATNIFVVQTSDFSQSGGVGYAMLDFKAHPSYDGQTSSPFDVAMIRVLGVDETTPVIPMLNPDTMAQGSRVTSVGFGRTVRPNQPSDAGSNTSKNKIDGTITRLTTAQMGVTYDNGGDICQGDSGGPVLATVGGKDFVVGVHSFVTGPCVGQGFSVRPAAHLAFIKSVLDEAAPEASCGLCKKTVSSGTQVCAKARLKCTDDPQCSGLRTCLGACNAAATDAGSDAGASDECKKACSVQFPFGAGPYNTLVAFCACKTCGDSCGGDSTCAGLPACGMKLAGDSCNSCAEGACCADMAACGADGHCYRCTKNPETPGCDTNELYQRLNSCRSSSCATQCAPSADGGTP